MTVTPTTSVARLDFGYFVRPGSETLSGAPQVEPCLGYLVEQDGTRLLFDTGMGAHPEVDAHYRPRRRSLPAALAAIGTSLDEVTLVANCHLHFDHCGGNPLLGDRPVFTQSIELEQARTVEDYTLTDLLEGTAFEPFDGEAEVLPGVWLIPTPGHTAGHQSLVVQRSDGTIVVAGQSHDTATAFGSDVLARHAHRDGHGQPLPEPASFMDRLLAFDPARVLFAHDNAVWTP
jgi:N-acyl homoserine lactone hydrolase